MRKYQYQVILGWHKVSCAMTSQITDISVVCTTVCSGAPRHCLCEGNPTVIGNFPHKGPATRKMFHFDYIIMGPCVSKGFHSHLGHYLICSKTALYFCVRFWHRQITLSAGRPTMMTSSNGNIFRVTGPLYWQFIGDRLIPPTKAIDAELWCSLWSPPKQPVE